MKVELQLKFGELGYIAAPYWPEIEWLIKLEQKAGLHPKHGADKRKQLLQTYCHDNEIPPEKVEAARSLIANEKWYRDANGLIYIPRHHFSACLVQALGSHPLKKEVGKDQLRTFVTVGDLAVKPEKVKADGVFARYIKNPDSNLRRYQEDEYIANFVAVGHIHFNEEIINPDSLESLISFAGTWVGVGSARKMGRGKFTLEAFQ